MINMHAESAHIDLFSSWTKLLGNDMEDIAAHSEPVDIKNNALIIYVDHPGWIQRIEFKKHHILRQVRKKYAHVSHILVQRVSNENFIQRREARYMGNNPKLSDSHHGEFTH